MEQEKNESLLKTPFFKWFLPVMMTIISVYFWINFAEFSFYKITGIAINIVGLIMWWVAKITLAKNWNVGFGKPKINRLVTHGIYSKVSHPMYWGINLTFVSLVIIYPKLWFIIVSLFVIIYFFSRMKIENVFLTEKLGEEYRNYKRRTWI